MPKNKKRKTYHSLLINTLQKKYVSFFIGLFVFLVMMIITGTIISKATLSLHLINKINFRPQSKSNKNSSIGKKYIVKQEDSLWKIAEQSYGSGYNAYDIAEFNNLKNPNNLTLGQEIILPDIKPRELTVGEISGTTTYIMNYPNNTKYYIVKQGEGLSQIAEAVYNNQELWTKIAEANNISDSNNIYENNVLIIPR